MTLSSSAAMTEAVLEAFVNVFRGRADCYGSAQGYCVNEPLTKDVFRRHLTSADPADQIGVYCMLGDKCSWGCIDIDGKDFPNGSGEHDWDTMWSLIDALHSALRYKGVPSHMERSRNGFHLWVFPQEPLVSAATMRRALIATCKVVGYDPKEVNPKAEGPRPGTRGLGNFVRLPYGGALAPGWSAQQRYMFDAAGGYPYDLDSWLPTVDRATTPALEAIAALYTPPPERTIDVNDVPLTDELKHKLGGKTFIIWRDGPYPIELGGSGDRSSTLARLVYSCRDDGLTESEALAVLRSADERWGKFSTRPDCEEQLMRLIAQVYG